MLVWHVIVVSFAAVVPLALAQASIFVFTLCHIDNDDFVSVIEARRSSCRSSGKFNLLFVLFLLNWECDYWIVTTQICTCSWTRTSFGSNSSIIDSLYWINCYISFRLMLAHWFEFTICFIRCILHSKYWNRLLDQHYWQSTQCSSHHYTVCFDCLCNRMIV